METNIQVFSEAWFAKHQRIILWFLNAPIKKLKAWARGKLHISELDVKLREKIYFIEPSRYICGGHLVWIPCTEHTKGTCSGKHLRREFRSVGYSGDVYSKDMYHAFEKTWWAIHNWDIKFANRFVPALNLGFDTLTAKPQAGSGGSNTTCDGHIYRNPNPSEDLVTIRAGAGTGNDGADDATIYACLNTNGTNSFGTFNYLYRPGATFSTNVGSGSTITSAVLSAYGNHKNNGLGTADLHVCSFAPAANNAIANGDFANFGTTSFGSVAYASFSTTGYNDITLNASGIANINKTGISGFGFKLSWDITGTFGGTWNGGNKWTEFDIYSADQGTSQALKLVVTYTLPAGNALLFAGD